MKRSMKFGLTVGLAAAVGGAFGAFSLVSEKGYKDNVLKLVDHLANAKGGEDRPGAVFSAYVGVAGLRMAEAYLDDLGGDTDKAKDLYLDISTNVIDKLYSSKESTTFLEVVEDLNTDISLVDYSENGFGSVDEVQVWTPEGEPMETKDKSVLEAANKLYGRIVNESMETIQKGYLNNAACSINKDIESLKSLVDKAETERYEPMPREN